MTRIPLTIGIATYQDPGLWFTLEALEMYHPRVNYLVIDNAPEPSREDRGVTQAVGGTYLHRPDLVGTSAPRDALFRLAETEWVLCIDSHVLLEPGAVQALLDFIELYPESNDLIQGPIVWSSGPVVSTHWKPTTPLGLWGTWDTYPCWQQDALFDIPMMGLGLFAMRKKAWPGFHRLFTGFGGEEGYIHEKIRRQGGRCLCLPRLLWRHKFRGMESGEPPPPYPLTKEDHTWNLLIGHRELGIDATELIRHEMGWSSDGTFASLVAEAEKVQPFGQEAKLKRLRLLGVWYSNNTAPVPLLQNSLKCVHQAQKQCRFHDVDIRASSWYRIPNNPFRCRVGRPKNSGHAAMIEQIFSCFSMTEDVSQYDGIVFLEHDVLYPPNYFDRIGDALTSGVDVVCDLNYEGLNETGWLPVKVRMEPLHQMGMRTDFAVSLLQNRQKDCAAGGFVCLEPYARPEWIRLSPTGLMPAIHVNHTQGRFTNYGEVCYEPSGVKNHPFWGNSKLWWS